MHGFVSTFSWGEKFGHEHFMKGEITQGGHIVLGSTAKSAVSKKR